MRALLGLAKKMRSSNFFFYTQNTLLWIERNGEALAVQEKISFEWKLFLIFFRHRFKFSCKILADERMTWLRYYVVIEFVEASRSEIVFFF